MSDLRRRIDRKLRDAATRRFAREIGASVLATIIGGALISHATRQDPAPVPATVKTGERLASMMVPERVVIMHDVPTPVAAAIGTATPASAMPASVMPAALRPAVQASLPVIPVRATRLAETGQRRVTPVVAVPPVRPADRLALAEADIAVVAREPVRIFGWSVPGSDLLPTGAEAVQSVAEVGRHVGRQVASVGGAIGERVGLR